MSRGVRFSVDTTIVDHKGERPTSAQPPTQSVAAVAAAAVAAAGAAAAATSSHSRKSVTAANSANSKHKKDETVKGTTSTDRFHLLSPPLLEGCDSSGFTPPGSPVGLHKEPSVRQLYRSARNSFQGRLQPSRNPIALEFPVRRGPSRMIPAQDWDVKETARAAGGELKVVSAESDGCLVDEKRQEKVCCVCVCVCCGGDGLVQ